MHIVIFVFGKTSTKDDVLFFIGQLLVLFINIIVIMIVDWIVRFVVVFPFGGVFTRNDCFILCTEFEMFMFDNTCKWHFRVCIVYDCISLVVRVIQCFFLES